MNNKIIHRDTGDEESYIHSDIGLCIKRLSIIDLSTAHQLIFDDDYGTSLNCMGKTIYIS